MFARATTRRTAEKIQQWVAEELWHAPIAPVWGTMCALQAAATTRSDARDSLNTASIYQHHRRNTT